VVEADVLVEGDEAAKATAVVAAAALAVALSFYSAGYWDYLLADNFLKHEPLFLMSFCL